MKGLLYRLQAEIAETFCLEIVPKYCITFKYVSMALPTLLEFKCIKLSLISYLGHIYWYVNLGFVELSLLVEVSKV